MAQVDQRHLDHLIEHGFAVVPGFLSADQVRAARADVLKYFPTPGELATTPHRYQAILDDPEHLQVEFPFDADVINYNSVHPDIIDLVERLLGTREILLSQSAIWAKYAGAGSFEQTMHLDYEGNTLVVPRDDGLFRQVNLILYYSDVTADMGPTHVVPQGLTRDLGLWPPFRPRKKWPKLYELEQPILAKAGDMLMFSMRTFHRAGEITAEAGARFTQHLVYRSSQCPFNGYHQYSQFGEKPEITRFVQNASPRQREMLGFPPPGHPYWNDETLKWVAKRYPEMDMAPYQ
jgi:hypothetical protein